MADDPILFRPETFARHERAFSYIRSRVRTRLTRKGTGRFSGLAPGAWGLLAAGGSISAASGLTLGTGNVKLCDRTGSVYVADETVTVKNAGPAISGGAGGKLLPLEWVEGEWTVCDCPTGLSCSPCNIPQQDLTLTWTYSGAGTAAYAFVWNSGLSRWDTGCTQPPGVSTSLRFLMTCTGGSILLQSNVYAGRVGCTSYITTNTYTIVDYTCSPFHLHHHDGNLDLYVDE